MIPSSPSLEREPFTAAVAARLVGAGMAPTPAAELAVALVADLLDFENIAFGAPGFDWTHDGARDLADFELHAPAG